VKNIVMEDGKVKCKRCNGRGEYRVRFTYKDKIYYYFSKCGHCYAQGYLDWVEVARGRLPGMAGVFCDTHPAGSCIVAPKKFGGCKVYDGHHYISTDTPRGEALWDKLVSGE
jgi:nitrite reductase/ring-hydroxylating ferredoxin subunit